MFFSAVCSALCLTVPSAGQAPKESPRSNLADYRTVATARTTKLVTNSTSGQTGYLGVAVVRDGKGRLMVDDVQPDSPAARAGLKSGDVITRIGDQAVSDPVAFRERLQVTPPEATVKLGLLRAEETLEVSATLAATSRPLKRAPTGKKGEVALTVWQKPAYRLAVVGIDFVDVRHDAGVSPGEWMQALFSVGAYNQKNATGQPVQGSLHDYLREQSGGAFTLEGKVFEWVALTRKRGDYIQGSGTSNKTVPLTEALDKLVAQGGQKALKDFDGILFLYAGERYPTNRGAVYYPHAGTLLYQGKRWPYMLTAAGGSRMTSVNSLTKLIGQMLGLPDLAARPEDAGSRGLGVWCPLSTPLLDGRPQHYGAWAKEKLGWLKPALIDPTIRQKLLLAPVEDSVRECFKVLVRLDGSEYYLLENRQKKGFDADLPGAGLLIWHVLNGRPSLRESHGLNGPIGPAVHLSAVPYPSDANTAFTPDTIPSSRSPLGGGLPVHITNIRQLSDGRIAFLIGTEFR